MLALVLLLLSIHCHTYAGFSYLGSRNTCGQGYGQCSPHGSTSNAPDINSALPSLYVNLLDSINSNSNHKRLSHILDTRSSLSVCCADGTLCLLLHDLDIPFCYDNYTTNFFLPDGSSGNLHSALYTLTNGTTLTLPSASTPLQTPTPYTSSGIGSAIPVTALGEIYTYTTTIPASTISPSTLPASTIPGSVSGGSTIDVVMTMTMSGANGAVETTTMTMSSLIGGSTVSGSTKDATTISGNTIEPITATVTTHKAGATGGAARVKMQIMGGAVAWGVAVLGLL